MASSAWRWVACTRSRGAGGAGSYPLAALAARALVAGRPGRARRARLAALAARALQACTHAHVTHDTRHTTQAHNLRYCLLRHLPPIRTDMLKDKCTQKVFSKSVKYFDEKFIFTTSFIALYFLFTVLALSTKEKFSM